MNFWQVFMSCIELLISCSMNCITKIGPALDYRLVVSYYFGNAAHNLGLYLTQNILAYGVRSQNIVRHYNWLTCQGKNSSFSQTVNVASFGCQAWNHESVGPHNSEYFNSTGWIWLNPLINVPSLLVTWALVVWSDGSLELLWTE